MDVQFSAEMMRVTDPRNRERQEFFRLARTAPADLHHRGPIYTAKNGSRWATGVTRDAHGYAWPLDAQSAKFEEIMNLEFESRGARASVAFQPTGTPLYRRQQLHEAAKTARDKLNAAIAALTMDEMRALVQYRAEVAAGLPTR